jgi:hypothetical protein
MREAQQQLDRGDADEAERAQERAEKNLEEAEKELEQQERRYRALRQFDLLFKLKEELKTYKRTTESHRDWLNRIDVAVREAGRVTRHIRREEIAKLSQQLGTLERDVSDKAGALENEGAVVYTYILKSCSNDLKEVGAQLELKEVGIIPQELLGDVVRRFDLAIKGLERDLRERREQEEQGGQQNQGQNQGQNGQKPPLVPTDAEIRMVMVLQTALNEERSNFFEARPDFGERPPSAGEKARIERLYHQQGSLAEIFDSLRQTLTQQAEGAEHEFPNDEEQR